MEISSGGDYVLVVKFSGGDYVLVVKFSRGDYVLVVKFSRGDYVLVVKFMGGILSTYTKMSRGGLSGGDYVRIPLVIAVIDTSLNFNDCDSIPNGALNSSRINIALNTGYKT